MGRSGMDGGSIDVPLVVGGQPVRLRVGQSPVVAGGESEIAWRQPSLEQALDSLMGVAGAISARLRDADATRVSVEFGCEFAIESGTFVAVIGKASATSAFKVCLEWESER